MMSRLAREPSIYCDRAVHARRDASAPVSASFEPSVYSATTGRLSSRRAEHLLWSNTASAQSEESRSSPTRFSWLYVPVSASHEPSIYCDRDVPVCPIPDVMSRLHMSRASTVTSLDTGSPKYSSASRAKPNPSIYCDTQRDESGGLGSKRAEHLLTHEKVVSGKT